jgi:hypothetical protein
MAFHEAGHAVAAWRQGRTINKVSIASGPLCGGPKLWDIPSYRDRPTAELTSAVIAILAGVEAEKMSARHYDRNTARFDLERALDLALYVGRDEEGAREWLRWPRLLARRLVDANRVHVKALAARLLEKGELTGPEGEAVLQGADRA